LRIGEEHAFFSGEALRKHENMGERTGKRGDPCGVNQREDQHLDEDSSVVGMANVTEGAGGDDAEACGVHDLNIPMISESANDPPADEIGGEENDKADCGENGKERTVEKHHFDGGSDQNGSVQEHHPPKAGIIHSGGATGYHLPLVAAGNAEFHEAQGRDRAEENEKCDNTQFHCSNKNSALKPGPKAPAKAYSPVLRGRFSSHS